MSLATGYTWTHGNLKLLGYSMAGISTSIAFPEADVCFDVAQGLPFQMSLSNLLITHGHMDHASGLPYLIAQKSMLSQPEPQVYLPPNCVEPLKRIMDCWREVEDHTYRYNFIPVEFGREYSLKPPYFFKAFPTFHRVPSVGYTVFERKKKLNTEFSNLTATELSQKRREGHAVDVVTSEPLISFTGDTKIEFLDHTDWIKNSKVLVMEVTFIDEKKTIENARHWGHIHLDELLPRLEHLKCERILIIHVSARYSTRQLEHILDARLPEHLKTKVQVFPRPI